MRIFTAIPLPSEIKEEIRRITERRLPVAYINYDVLHITLNFFGELTDSEVSNAKEIFVEVSSKFKPFTVELDSIHKHHQQIHITVKSTSDFLYFQSTLEQNFEKAGFRFQERLYYPHIKLANMHMDKVMKTERKIENFSNEELNRIKFTASIIVLYESKLLLHHAHHYPLLEVKL